MAAHKIRCFDSKCGGLPIALNDAISRLGAAMGRLHYQCNQCHSRWSVDPAWYADQMKPSKYPFI